LTEIVAPSSISLPKENTSLSSRQTNEG